MYYDTLETVKTAEEDCFGRLLKLFSSLRISLSYLTTKEELDKFLKSFSNNFNRLSSLNKH